MTKRIISRVDGKTVKADKPKAKAAPKKEPAKPPEGLRASQAPVKRADRKCSKCANNMVFNSNDLTWRCWICGNVEVQNPSEAPSYGSPQTYMSNDWELIIQSRNGTKLESVAIYSRKYNVIVELPNVVDVSVRNDSVDTTYDITASFRNVRVVQTP